MCEQIRSCQLECLFHEQQIQDKMSQTDIALKNLYDQVIKHQQPTQQQCSHNLQQYFVQQSTFYGNNQGSGHPVQVLTPIPNRHQKKQSTSFDNVFYEENQRLREKLQQKDALLQSYRQEVQYLKKVNGIQDKQIDKLRAIIRSNQQQAAIGGSSLSQNNIRQSSAHTERTENEKPNKMTKKQLKKKSGKQQPNISSRQVTNSRKQNKTKR